MSGEDRNSPMQELGYQPWRSLYRDCWTEILSKQLWKEQYGSDIPEEIMEDLLQNEDLTISPSLVSPASRYPGTDPTSPWFGGFKETSAYKGSPSRELLDISNPSVLTGGYIEQWKGQNNCVDASSVRLSATDTELDIYSERTESLKRKHDADDEDSAFAFKKPKHTMISDGALSSNAEKIQAMVSISVRNEPPKGSSNKHCKNVAFQEDATEDDDIAVARPSATCNIDNDEALPSNSNKVQGIVSIPFRNESCKGNSNKPCKKVAFQEDVTEDDNAAVARTSATCNIDIGEAVSPNSANKVQGKVSISVRNEPSKGSSNKPCKKVAFQQDVTADDDTAVARTSARCVNVGEKEIVGLKRKLYSPTSCSLVSSEKKKKVQLTLPKKEPMKFTMIKKNRSNREKKVFSINEISPNMGRELIDDMAADAEVDFFMRSGGPPSVMMIRGVPFQYELPPNYVARQTVENKPSQSTKLNDTPYSRQNGIPNNDTPYPQLETIVENVTPYPQLKSRTVNGTPYPQSKARTVNGTPYPNPKAMTIGGTPYPQLEATANGTPNPTANGTPYPTTNGSPYPTVNGTPYNTASGTASSTINGSPYPTANGTLYSTANGSPHPTVSGTSYPTASGTPYPTASGTSYPTASGTSYPTASGTPYPTASGTPYPTASGTSYPTASGTSYPTASGTPYPTASGTSYPTASGTPYSTVSNTPYSIANGSAYPTANDTPYPAVNSKSFEEAFAGCSKDHAESTDDMSPSSPYFIDEETDEIFSYGEPPRLTTEHSEFAIRILNPWPSRTRSKPRLQPIKVIGTIDVNNSPAHWRRPKPHNNDATEQK